MLVIHERQYSIMVMFAVALHLWWAFLIMVDNAALGATGVASLHRYIHSPMLLAATIAAAAVMALVGTVSRISWLFMLMVPQQVLLMMSAAGSVEAMWIAQFADGVLRPRAFIAADQVYSILAAAGHTLAVVAYAVRPRA